MRILHAVRSDGFAGVESHVARLARAQHQLGHDVVVIGGDPLRMPLVAGGGVRTVPASTVVEVFDAARPWAAGADIIHSHMTAAEVACAAVLFGQRTPLVATCHFARERGSNPVSSAAVRYAARRIDRQIAISRFVADRVAGPSVVIHPGVDSTSGSRPASERDRVLLLAQRLEPEKEGDLAIRAFAASGIAHEGWRLDIAGIGSEHVRLARLAAELDVVASVRFLGQRSDVPELMSRAGILLAPCRVEGLGLSVLEAMAAALPVVAVAAGGHLETVGRAEGATLHPPGDAVRAGALLARLAADAHERDAYGERLQSLQRELFTPAHQAEATDAVYRSVL
ncbi:hypothetical protein UB45_01810 [Terrabacter sp. 28]|nr:hypothetical protein UB45_01810 [Terrabacter sp. 28]